MKTFNAVIEDNKDNFAHLGVKLGDLGSHSTQKDSAAMVAVRFTASPQ